MEPAQMDAHIKKRVRQGPRAGESGLQHKLEIRGLAIQRSERILIQKNETIRELSDRVERRGMVKGIRRLGSWWRG
jgi:hypothetical protein